MPPARRGSRRLHPLRGRHGDIQIFYKNSAADVYYGGITYMVRIKGGLKAGQLQQLMPSHFSAGNSEILFIVIP